MHRAETRPGQSAGCRSGPFVLATGSANPSSSRVSPSEWLACPNHGHGALTPARDSFETLRVPGHGSIRQQRIYLSDQPNSDVIRVMINVLRCFTSRVSTSSAVTEFSFSSIHVYVCRLLQLSRRTIPGICRRLGRSGKIYSRTLRIPTDPSPPILLANYSTPREIK